LFIYVGQRRAFGPFSAFGKKKSLLDTILRKESRGPESLTPDIIDSAAQALADVAHRFAAELSQAGMSNRFFDEEQLVGRIFSALNPVSGSTARPPRIVDAPPTRPEEIGDYLISRQFTLREQLPRGDLYCGDHHFTVDEPAMLSRALSLQTLPSETTPDYLFGVQFALPTPFRLVSTFVATDLGKLTEQFLSKQRIATSETGGHVRNVQAEIALSDIEGLLQQLTRFDQRIFESSMTAIVTAQSPSELDQYSARVKECFRGNADMTTEVGRQLRSFLSTLPGYGFSSPRTWRLHTNAAADLIPYFVPSSGDREASLVYHTRQSGLRKVSFGAERPNRNALVFGSSGSGKSFNIAAVLEQAGLAQGGPAFIVDVQGPAVSNYKVLAELFGGTYTSLSLDDAGGASFTPFPAPDVFLVPRPEDPSKRRPDPERLAFLSQLVAVIGMPDIATHGRKALILEVAKIAVVTAYENVRIRHQRKTGTKEGAPAPIFSDVVAALNIRAPADPDVPHRVQLAEAEYEPLAREMYLQLEARLKTPTWSRLLNRHGTFASTTQFQVFDFFGMEKDPELATVLLMIVANYIWTTIQQTPREVTKFVLFDECWKLLTHPIAAEVVAELYRTGRKWGASTWAITQSLNDLQTSPVSAALLANSATIWLNKHTTDFERVASFCELNDRQLHLFKKLEFQAGQYSEILFVDRAVNDATVLRYYPTPFDLWLNTTSPQDVGFRERLRRDRGLSMAQAIKVCADEFPRGAPRA
jgi:hypothetical protein